MSLRSFARLWNQFFFREQSPVAMALFRIVYGALVIATLGLLRPDWLNWYGVHAWLSLPTALKLGPGLRLNLFSIIPQSDAWIEAFFWFALVSATLLTLGLFTRINSILVFICLTSIQQRNLYITHGGDTFLRLAGFFLIFAPAGAALSLDRVIRIRRGKESRRIQPRSPWAQRMIQLQLSFMYLVAFLIKIKGAPWLHGTALAYVYHLDELRHFPIPGWFFRPTVLELGTWSALALEFSLGTLIWVKELRYPLLALGLLFHLWLEYSLNIPLFQWDILSAYVLFIDADDLSRTGHKIQKHIATWHEVDCDSDPERHLPARFGTNR
ncbi:MAG: HTTM domain-containing protein [Terriglobales bacterium]